MDEIYNKEQRGGIYMFNNIKAIEKIIREENRKVIKAENSSKIKKQGSERDRSSSTFEENLNQAKQYKRPKDKKNTNLIEEDIIISSSLGNLIKENKTIERLVLKRFSKYPGLIEKNTSKR